MARLELNIKLFRFKIQRSDPVDISGDTSRLRSRDVFPKIEIDR